MKKNWTVKVAALLLALTMVTACFVGSTFAKYVSKAEGEATARVAKWGIVMDVEGGDGVFKTQYNKDDNTATTIGDYSVKAYNGTDKLVAPGTEGEPVKVTISGTPEVAFKLVLELISNDDIYLEAGEYTDYSTVNLAGEHPKFTLNEDYHPIQYTIKINIPGIGEKSMTGSMQDIIDALNRFGNQHDGSDNLTAMFAPGTSVEGTIELSWEWPFEQNNMDQADTFLGNAIAGVDMENADKAHTALDFNIIATATQID